MSTLPTPVRTRSDVPVVSPSPVVDLPPGLDDDAMPVGVQLERAPHLGRFGAFVAVIVPFLGLIAAMIWSWDPRFSWLNLYLLIGGYLVSGFGITIGYHRLFTHKAFQAGSVVRAALGIMGCMAVEGKILDWVAIHRQHHQHTDREDDPHSPHLHGRGWKARIRGFLHSHIGWFFGPNVGKDLLDRYVPDLQADPVVKKVSDLFGLWVVLGLLIPAAIGAIVTQTWTGTLLAFVWGGLVRVLLVHHATWSINSVCHIWGRQPFDTHDESRDNAIFGVVFGLGEGWHNTHHAFPTSARQGLEWWQIDVSYYIIKVMGWLGLAKDIKVPSRERIEAKRVRRAA